MTSIAKNAFDGCASLTGITIASSVKTIGKYAFTGCTGLTKITIPDKVTTIQEGTFQECTALTSVTLPSGLKKIASDSFWNCESLLSITIPSTVTSIGSDAFGRCTALTALVIPSGVTSISSGTFSGCTGLSRILIPASVTSIGNDAFQGCTSLSDIYYAGTKKKWSAISIGNSNESLTSSVIHYKATSLGSGTLASCRVSSLTNTAKGIKITWSRVANADGYQIYRKTKTGSYKLIKTIKSGSTLSYTDTSVKSKNTAVYYYKVRAYSGSKKGSGIEMMTVRLTGTVITGYQILSDGTVQVQWKQSDGVSGYKLQLTDTDGTGLGTSMVKKAATTSTALSISENGYVRIRTYVKINGTTYLSAWSSKVYIEFK